MQDSFSENQQNSKTEYTEKERIYVLSFFIRIYNVFLNIVDNSDNYIYNVINKNLP